MNETELIKQKIDIVEFISQYLSLKKAGANYKAPCPFHQEKTPSFMVSFDKQIFKCFGCGEGGDIFDFLMKMENLDFPEALKILADRAGVQLDHSKTKQEYRQEKDLKTKLFEINRLAADYFHKMLMENRAGEPALKYLKSRGLKEATIKKFEIGFAPGQNVLKQALIQKDYSEAEINQAGDPSRFRSRIMFPLFDVLGNVVGFSGRATGDDQMPKYLNTADSPIFQKSLVLYALNFAKEEIKKRDFAVLVEGQMDVAMSHQSGVTNAVASSGTAITATHLHRLSRYSPNLILAFDTDEAGMVASRRAVELAFEEEMNVKIVVLEGVKDPAEAVAAGATVWKKALQNAKEAMQFFLEKALSAEKELDVLAKRRVATKLLPLVNHFSEPIAKEHWIKKIARTLGVTEETINLALAKIARNRPEEVTLPKEAKKMNLEKELVKLLIINPKFIAKINKDLSLKSLTEKDERIYENIKIWYNSHEKQEFLSWLEKKDRLLSNEAKLFFLQSQKEKGQEEDSTILEEIKQIIDRLQQKTTEGIKEKFEMAIRAAEEAGDRGKVKELIAQFQQEIISK